jgi:hypothetical protein
VRLRSDAFEQRSRQPRDLPIPGSPDSSTTWPSAALRLRPAPQQQFEFFLSPYKLGQAGCVESVKAA